jgi:folate-binding protein YgfZ
MNDSAVSLAISPCTVLRLSGPDRERFLNGQVSNDVRLATPARAIFSAVLNAKGQLDAICWIREHDGAYLIDAPLSLRDGLYHRLERYIIADDVTLADESEKWHILHCGGDELEADVSGPERGLPCAADRLGLVNGTDWLSEDPGLLTEGKALLTPEETTALRIEHGVPAWGAELTPGLLPPEAGLDSTAVSYDKGCYLGQEVISRMKRAGKTNRHLAQFEVTSVADTPCELLQDGQVAGMLTSVSPVERGGRRLALGFRKGKFSGTSAFTAGGGEARLLRPLAGAAP